MVQFRQLIFGDRRNNAIWIGGTFAALALLRYQTKCTRQQFAWVYHFLNEYREGKMSEHTRQRGDLESISNSQLGPDTIENVMARMSTG